MKDTLEVLLQNGPVIINLGLRDFAEALEDQGAQVIHVDWMPPAEGDKDMADLLDKLL